MLGNQGTNLVNAGSALAGNTLQLELGGCRSDVRIKAGSGCRHEVDRNFLPRIVCLSRRDVTLDSIDQLLIRRTQIGASGVGSIVTVACGGRSGVKVSRPGEALTNNAGTYNLAVLLNQLTVRLVRKNYLCQSSYNQWVDDPQ